MTPVLLVHAHVVGPGFGEDLRPDSAGHYGPQPERRPVPGPDLPYRVRSHLTHQEDVHVPRTVHPDSERHLDVPGAARPVWKHTLAGRPPLPAYLSMASGTVLSTLSTGTTAT